MKKFKFIAISIAALTLAACGGGGGGGGGGAAPAPGPTPSPVAVGTGVNIGNVSTIPVGLGGGSTSAIVTNNFPDQVTLISATYTVTGSAPRDATIPGGPVNTALCTTIQRLGSCNLGLSIPEGSTSEGQYLVTLTYSDPTNGQEVSTSQVVSYSAAVPVTSNGVQVSTINNTLFNLPGTSTTYAVPFVLATATNNLTATSENGNPAFAPTISCVGQAPYPAGTACTLYTKISQTGNAGIVSGNITVSGDPVSVASSKAQLKSKLINAKATTGYLFNVPVTVVQNNSGNLITSAINVVVSPADGTSPQTITLLNNGNASITGINITGATPTTVGLGTCASGTLAANASCTFTVNATLTQNAQSSVTVNYTSNGSSNSLAFNVIYKVAASTAGLSMTASGNFTNTVVNTASFINVTVTNTGTAPLTSIAFTPLAGTPAGMTYTSNGSCATNGTQALSAGQSCTLQIQYLPLATASGTLTLREIANYVDQGGSTASYTAATASISYSAITGQAFVYISPNFVAYGIRAESVDSISQTFAIVNAGPIATTVNPESLANPGIANYTITGSTGNCSAFASNGPIALGAAGSGTESCTVTATYGPTSAVVNTSAQMLATYLTSGSSTATAFSTLSFTSSKSALISISNMAVTGASGNGSVGTPYTFRNSPESAQIQVTLTYRNSGTESALLFNVALNTLPVGYYSSGGTCGFGTATTTLAPSGTCTVIFSAESTALFNSYSLGGSMPFNFPGFSYVESATGLNVNSSPTYSTFGRTVYVTATVPLNSVTESPAVWTTGTAGGTNDVFFTASPAVPVGVRVTILNQGFFANTLTFGFGTGSSNAGACIIAAAGTSCSIPITNVSGMLLNTPINFFYLIAPATIPATGVTKSGSITYTN